MMTRSKAPRAAFRTLALLTVLALWVAAAAPAAGQQISDRELYDKSLEVARKALEQYGVYDDRDELARVNDIGYRVAQESRFTEFPLTFHLVDMPEPNAFALPGGQLFVTHGMLDLGLTDDMLAGLLGHEIGHVALHHHLRMQRRATLMNVLSQALMVGVMVGAEGNRGGSNAPYRSPDVRGGRGSGEMVQGAVATSLIVSELLLRSFSREHEDEADEEGQRWAAAAGFGPTGTRELMELMGSRLPQDKKYGYWRTHPFFDERVRAAKARGELLKPLKPKPADDFRIRTQAALVTYYEQAPAGSESAPLVRDEALAAWPRGAAAETIRLAMLHEARETELGRVPLGRDYGALLRAYAEQAAEIERLTPASPLLATLAKETAELEAAATELYPKAVAVVEGEVYETALLERFLSTWPESPEAPKAALLLGDARSRLGDETDAVRHYLRAWETAPASAEGQRAAAGLRTLAPTLTQLAALEQLAGQQRDPELARLAAARLDQMAGSFQDVDNGAEYLRRFPDGSRIEPVTDRLNELADKLYAELILYQAIGDHVKAVERINKILTYAPLSPAADLLRERAVVES
jgi:predicted Zn-dependent protease